MRGGADSPETLASKRPPQRRDTLRGALARPAPDLRILDRLRAVQGAKFARRVTYWSLETLAALSVLI